MKTQVPKSSAKKLAKPHLPLWFTGLSVELSWRRRKGQRENHPKESEMRNSDYNITFFLKYVFINGIGESISIDFTDEYFKFCFLFKAR